MNKRERRNALRVQLKENIDWDDLDVRYHKPWTNVYFVTKYTAGNGKVVTKSLWGVSKICWPDKWDETTGMNMAIDRAIGWAVTEIIPPERDNG